MTPNAPDKQRTLAQNRALHLFFTQLAQELNDNGLDMKKTLKPEIDIPWSGETVKEFLWRPVMKAQLHKESTTEMTSREIDEVFETIARHLGEKFGLELEFPSIETIIAESLAKGKKK